MACYQAVVAASNDIDFSLSIHVTPPPPVPVVTTLSFTRPKERHLAWILAAHVTRSYPPFYGLSFLAQSLGASGYREGVPLPVVRISQISIHMQTAKKPI